jgi:hypothetical protein
MVDYLIRCAGDLVPVNPIGRMPDIIQILCIPPFSDVFSRVVIILILIVITILILIFFRPVPRVQEERGGEIGDYDQDYD